MRKQYGESLQNKFFLELVLETQSIFHTTSCLPLLGIFFGTDQGQGESELKNHRLYVGAMRGEPFTASQCHLVLLRNNLTYR